MFKTITMLLAYILLCVGMSIHIFLDLRGHYYTREVPTGIVDLEPVSLYKKKQDNTITPEVQCLAKNIYHEARGEGIEGMVGVASVTLNRVESFHFPDSICEVVYQPFQFSWVNEQMKLNLENHIERKAWEVSKDVALMVLIKGVPDDMLGVYNYHATHIKPKWSHKKIKHKTISNHVFYTSATYD